MAPALLLCLLLAQGTWLVAGSAFASENAAGGRKLQQFFSTEPTCYLGCYADSYQPRAEKRFLYKQDQEMSVEACHGAAIKKNYSHFAVQFGRECWALKNVRRGVMYGPSSGCNYTCTGNRQETCGGWLAFNLYARGTCQSPSPPPSSPPPSPPPPSPPTQPPYKFSMVFLTSNVKWCRQTNDTLWTEIVQPLGSQNKSICRCDVGTTSPTSTQSITVSTRFTASADLNAVVSDVLDLSTGDAEALLSAAHSPCSNSPKDTKMSMIIVDPTPTNPQRQYGVYFVCNNTALPPSDALFSYVGAPFRCCNPTVSP